MARIRTIKPEFFLDEEIARLEPLTRLFYQALWLQADRSGRLEDRPAKIKAQALPYDACDCEEMLSTLDELGFIVRYQVAGKAYIFIRTFEKHQRPNSREPQSTIPAVPKSLKPARARTRAHAHAQEEGNGVREGKGMEVPASADLAADAALSDHIDSLSVPAKSWSSEACDDWNDRYGPGTAPGGRIGAAIAPVIKALAKELHEPEADSWAGTVRPAWRRYLAETTHPSPSAQDFASHFGQWTVATANNGLVPLAPARSAGRGNLDERNGKAIETWLRGRAAAGGNQ
jgi:hypothetical protein